MSTDWLKVARTGPLTATGARNWSLPPMTSGIRTFRGSGSLTAPWPNASKGRSMDKGELWSFLRSTLSQGGDIWIDHQTKGYEQYSARLDAAARERADTLVALMRPICQKCTGSGLAQDGTPCVHCSGPKHPRGEVHERVCWSCQAIYTGALAADGKCPNCRPKCACVDDPLRGDADCPVHGR
jgi:hypothetical protein